MLTPALPNEIGPVNKFLTLNIEKGKDFSFVFMKVLKVNDWIDSGARFNSVKEMPVGVGGIPQVLKAVTSLDMWAHGCAAFRLIYLERLVQSWIPLLQRKLRSMP
ncbi:hypothetical protein J6590_086733 [Homalodisca vitripennis]|nr:hypothetical protein J6590_086733 [Homalodisca vitripennis]